MFSYFTLCHVFCYFTTLFPGLLFGSMVQINQIKSMVESMFAFQENNVFVVKAFLCTYCMSGFFTSCEVTLITSASLFLLCTNLMTLKPCGVCSMCANRCSFFWRGAFVDSEIRVS